MSSLNKPSNILIRDCSKYGTFIHKNPGPKEKLHDLPNKESNLQDGDLVSFGTGNATYRFCFVPLIFFVCSEPLQANQPLEDKISSIGAHITHNLTQECTHVLVDQLRPVKEDLADAIVAKKHFVLNSWVEFVAEKSIRTEIPSCSSYTPMLTVEGKSVKVADPESRENCLEGYTFLLESLHMYKFGHRLQSLLEVGGAKIVTIERFCPSSQDSDYGDNDRVVCVIPGGSTDKADRFKKLSSLSRVNEMDLICAVLTGRLDPSKLISPCILVSSSCSTDETVVADSDAEAETVTSVHATATVCTNEAIKHVTKAEISMDHDPRRSEDSHISSIRDSDCGMTVIREAETATSIHATATICTKEAIKHATKAEISMDHTARRSEDSHISSIRDSDCGMTVIRDKVDDSECKNSDIIYSQDLVVRDMDMPSTVSTTANNGVLNFKCFRKKNAQSGNSFNNLIPFSKYPYKDSDYGSEDMVESVKAEKKRKQMEAVAEDLFNTEKGRRRGVAGSLRGLLTHS